MNCCGACSKKWRRCVIDKQVYSIISAVLEIDESQVNSGSGAHNTANWDSLASINIVLEVEKLAGRPLDLLELAGVKTAGDLVEIVSNAAAGVDK